MVDSQMGVGESLANPANHLGQIANLFNMTDSATQSTSLGVKFTMGSKLTMPNESFHDTKPFNPS
jgi:hypothetical protein